MTARLAVEMGDVFAAAGLVSAPPIDLGGSDPFPHPIPLIAFYGTADPLVKYEGGVVAASPLTTLIRLPAHRLAFPPVRPWIESWARHNGCQPTSEALPTPLGIKGEKFVGCQDGAEVVFYTIAGGGHTWPGGSPTFIGKTSRKIDATRLMWEFFKQHLR